MSVKSHYSHISIGGVINFRLFAGMCDVSYLENSYFLQYTLVTCTSHF